MTPTPATAVGRAGELFEISNGDRRAVVTEQGANLFKVEWAGVDLLNAVNDDGFTVGGSHGALLLPWPGRIRSGVYHFEGERYQLAVTDLASGSAIHGLTRFLTWQVKEHHSSEVILTCRFLAEPGYPFPLLLEQSYRWHDESLEISTLAKNIGARTAPFGFGAHPYFTTGGPTVDNSVLQLAAAQYFETNTDLSPKVPPLPVDGTQFDFRQPKAIGQAQLDVTLTDLARDAEGRASANFRSPDGAISITCRYDEPIRYLQVYSGDTLSAHKREGLAIEPCTCPPDAFNNGVGLISLAPGASVSVRWSISAD
jgi:aldose 1-epimerase